MLRNKVIMLADSQSFYASVEKALDPELVGKPVAVCGDPARRSGIVLAACPLAKAKGVTTAERIGEALSKCPELVVVRPKMQTYIDVSLQITKIYETFSDLVEPFSIDESFIDTTESLHLFGSPEQLAKQMQDKVMHQTRVYIRVGVGPTKVLAKTACDNFAKKNQSGIYFLTPELLPSTLWLLPISNMYMVGSRMTAHMERMGIRTIGDLALTPLPKFKDMMRARMGKNADIHAEMCWRIANGIDYSPVTPDTHIGEKSIGHMMTLPRDYSTWDDIRVVLLELCELVARRCRARGKMGKTLSVSCGGADFDRPTGFHRQMTLLDPTHITNEIYINASELFKRNWDGLPVRRIGVSMTGFQSDEEYQLTFDDRRERIGALEKITDRLKDKYGDSIIMRASSASDAGQARDRSAKIGGHFK